MEDGGLPVGDKLMLRGLKFHGFHGVKPEEKELGQKFMVDLDAWLDMRKAGETDDLAHTFSYTEVYWIVKDVVEGQPYNLVETVAETIAKLTFEKCPQISAIRVKIGKPHVAMYRNVDFIGIEIIRYNKKNTASGTRSSKKEEL